MLPMCLENAQVHLKRHSKMWHCPSSGIDIRDLENERLKGFWDPAPGFHRVHEASLSAKGVVLLPIH